MKPIYFSGEALQAAIRFKLPDITPVPDDINPVVSWLARLRLLHGVPFPYLVPHDEFLPHESIRFFYINRNWTDRAVEGALSVGGITTQDRSLLQQAYDHLRKAVDQQERRVAGEERGTSQMQGDAEVLTGFLLRSHAVSGWPGMHVRAYRKAQSSGTGTSINNEDTEVELLRMERLAPAVLLVIMDGVPDRVEMEEPRQGIQFGVRPKASNSNHRFVPLRNPETGANFGSDETSGGEATDVTIPFRKGSPGVIDLQALSKRMVDQDPGSTLGSSLDSAEFGLQMLRYPYQQTFGEQQAVGISAVFKATLDINKILFVGQ